MARLRGKTGTYDQGIIASASAPGSGYVGQLWFNNSTGVLYQYMHDGTSNFWLDISSGGIGTSISEGVDVVGDIDPHKSINPSGGVGSVYFNREKNRHFVCTDASSNANVWAGRFTGNGGDILYTEVTSVWYRTHTFKTNGVFDIESATACDILVVGGGGGGGYWGGCGGGGGGVYQRLATGGSAYTLPAGTYRVQVGKGGASKYGAASGDQRHGHSGENSKLGDIHIGFGGGGGGSYDNAGIDGACGGGRDNDGSNTEVGVSLANISNGANLNGDVVTADHKTYTFSQVTTQGDNGVINGGAGAGAGGAIGTWTSGTSSMASPGHVGHGGIGKLITWATHEGTSATNTTGGTRGYYAGGGAGTEGGNSSSGDDPDGHPKWTTGNVPGGSGKPCIANTGAGGVGDGLTQGDGADGIIIIRYAL